MEFPEWAADLGIQRPQVWEIVGGEDCGGVLVRTGPELSSPKAPARLSFGARVLELTVIVLDELTGQRLHFQRLTGNGPEEGWISVTLNKKLLAKKVVAPLFHGQVHGKAQEPRAVDPGLNISGRWTFTNTMTWQQSFIVIKHRTGSETFTGRQIETNTDITCCRIFQGSVEFRIGDHSVKGDLMDSGRSMKNVAVWHTEFGTSAGYYTGQWDPGKDKFLVDNSLLQAEGPGLSYRKSKRLEDVDARNTAEWGTIVVGIDQWDGWVKILDGYLPKEVDGKTVLRDPSEPLPPPPPKPVAPKPRRVPAARAVRQQRQPFAPPEHLLGSQVPNAPKLTRAQAARLQAELVRTYSEGPFQRSLRAALAAVPGGAAERAEALRKVCAKAHTAALTKVKFAAQDKGEALCITEHLGSIDKDSELCCNALLLKWLLDPELQALSQAPAAGAASAGEAAAGATKAEGGYEVLMTDPEDESVIRGIGRCRAAFARAHQDLYRPFYAGMLQAEWLSVLGRESTEAYLEKGVIMLHAESVSSREVVGYISCRCEERGASISHIGVLPAHQGQGVGRMLFEQLLQHLASVASEASETLWINVVELNTRAVSWYRRLGFSTVNTWQRSFCAKGDRVPVVFLEMQRASGASTRPTLFRREICGTRVAVFPPQAPAAFLEAAAQGRWPWLCLASVAGYESDTGLHQLQDGRRVDFNLGYSHGHAFFDKPLHAILSR